MIIFLYALFLTIYAFLGAYAILMNYKAAINRQFFAIVGLFSVWLVAGLFRNLVDNALTKTFWLFISFMVLVHGSAMILHFSLMLSDINPSNSYKIRKIKKHYLLLYVPSWILYIGILILQPFDELYSFEHSVWYAIFGMFGATIYHLSQILCSVYVLIKSAKRSATKRYRLQKIWVAVTLLASTILVFIYSSLYPVFISRPQPIILPLFTIIWIVGMWYAIVKYKMLRFRPDLAHQEIMDNILDVVMICDEDGRILDVNQRIKTLTGYDPASYEGLQVWELLHLEGTCREKVSALKEGQGSQCLEETFILSNSGQKIPLRVTITIVSDRFEEVMGLVIAAEDMSAEVALKKLSITDPLTQLNNRLLLDEKMAAELLRAKRTRCVFSIILLDIDYFKRINDGYGHAAGDQVLIKVGQIMTQNIRMTDTCGRWGGEEFIVLLIDTLIDDGLVVAEKLRVLIESEDFGVGPQITCSFGVASWEDDMTYEAVVSRADKALYRAKEAGRNCSMGLRKES